MGSWHETCGLTHLQILRDDKIKFIILFEIKANARNCYYNGSYAPLSFPISGEYNDYGGVKNIKVPEFALTFLSKLNYFIKKEDGEDLEDVYEKYIFTSVEKLIEDIIENDNIYFDYGVGVNTKYKLTYIYYHEDIYDILVNDFKKRKVYDHKENFYELNVKKYEKIKEDFLRIKELENKIDKITNDYSCFDELLSLKYGLRDRLYKTAEYKFSFPLQYIYMNVLNKDNIDDFIEELIDYIMFAESLDSGRYGYYCSCGSGGDDLDVRVQELVSKFTLDFIKRKNEDGDKVYTKRETIFWWED